MDSTNKKPTGARGITQPSKRPEVPAPHAKPTVAQLKTGMSAQSIKQPVAPPVYRPQQAQRTLQTKSAAALTPQAGQAQRQPVAVPVYRPEANKIVQLNKKCTCGKSGKSGNKHLSSCPANKNFNKNATIKVAKQQRQVTTYENLKCYRPGWVKKNGITEEHVKEWGGKIHGHCSSSSDKDSGEQERTKTDLAAFKSWFTTNYGWQ
jgi:hypothetical protein